MKDVELPTPHEFIEMVRKHFAFLESNGFHTESEIHGTGEAIIFKSEYAAVAISSDRRDQCIDFSVAELAADGTVPRWNNFFGYLVQSMGYRGSLREFQNIDLLLHSCESNLQTYASALQYFLPQLVTGGYQAFR